ncbi:MAG: hypothetical protein HY053_03070 [Proteobacteria bacterium]|nr:hypothetical protein [Pseudomonadota bacterium]
MSRHYRKEFADFRGNLRIDRIEGLSRYDDAVNWRVSDNLDVIDEIGDRFKRLQDVLPLISNQLQMAESIETTRASASMLEKADFVVWQVLVPYYGPEIIYKFFDKSKLFEQSFGKDWYNKIDLYVRGVILMYGTYMANKKRLARLAASTSRGISSASNAAQRSTIRKMEWTRTTAETLVANSKKTLRRSPLRLRHYFRRRFGPES